MVNMINNAEGDTNHQHCENKFKMLGYLLVCVLGLKISEKGQRMFITDTWSKR